MKDHKPRNLKKVQFEGSPIEREIDEAANKKIDKIIQQGPQENQEFVDFPVYGEDEFDTWFKKL